MTFSRLPWFRRGLAACAGLMILSLVQAQTAAPPPPAERDAQRQQKQEERAAGRANQKIEHIHVEDRNASVDEVRYGGQTQSITVTPKSNMPPYEVLPSDNGRPPQSQAGSGTSGNGPRVWNVLKF